MEKFFTKNSKGNKQLEMKELKTKFKELYNKEIEQRVKERNKLYSKTNKLNSEIIKFFYKFKQENNCVIEWEDYDFKLKDIQVKEKE